MSNQQPLLAVLVALICFSALSLAQITSPAITWARGIGSTSNDIIQQSTSVVWASSDKSAFYVCAQSSSSLIIDSVAIEITEGSPTPYLLKFKTADRSLIWGKLLSSSESVGCEHVIVDEGSNEVYTLVSGNTNWVIFKFDSDSTAAPNYPIVIPLHEYGRIALFGEFLYFSGHASQNLEALGCSGNAWIGFWSKTSAESYNKKCITSMQGAVRIASLITHKDSNKVFLTGSFTGTQLEIAPILVEQAYAGGTLFLAKFEAADISTTLLKRINQDEARIALDMQSTSTKLFITTFSGDILKSFIHFLDLDAGEFANQISYQNILLKSMAILSDDKLVLAGDQVKMDLQVIAPNGDAYAPPTVKNPFVTAVKTDSTFEWLYSLPNSDSTTGQVSLIKDLNVYLLFGTTLNLEGYDVGPNQGLSDLYMIGYKIPPVIPPTIPSASIRPRTSPITPRNSSSIQPAASSKPIIIIPPVTFIQNVTFFINTTTNTVDKPILFVLNHTQIDVIIDSNTTFVFPPQEISASSNQTSQSLSIEIVTQNLNLEQFSGVHLPSSYNVFEHNNVNIKVGEVIGNGVTISSSAFGLNNVEICAKVIRTQVSSAYNVYSFAVKTYNNDKYVNQRNASAQIYQKGAQICSRVSFSISSSRVDLVFPAKVQQAPSATSTPISSASNITGSIIVTLVLVLQVLF